MIFCLHQSPAGGRWGGAPCSHLGLQAPFTCDPPSSPLGSWMGGLGMGQAWKKHTPLLCIFCWLEFIDLATVHGKSNRTCSEAGSPRRQSTDTSDLRKGLSQGWRQLSFPTNTQLMRKTHKPLSQPNIEVWCRYFKGKHCVLNPRSALTNGVSLGVVTVAIAKQLLSVCYKWGGILID